MLFLGILGACSLEDASDPSPKIGISDDVVLLINQNLSPEGSRLVFTFKSSNTDLCEGASFRHKLVESTGEKLIHLIDFQHPNPCTGHMSPAIKELPLQSVAGLYALDIDLGDVIHNEGALLIDSTHFEINMVTRHGLKISNTVLNKIPKYTIWGYVHHPNKVSNALDIINENLSGDLSQNSLLPGYYGQFTINEEFGITLPEVENLPGAKAFMYTFSEDPSQLQEVVNNIRLQLPPSSEFHLYTWSGLEF